MKVELHSHTADDPADRIPYTTRDLIDHAARLGYGGLAVTLHDKWLDPASNAGYARDRGITLIPGVERTIAGTHILLVNAPPDVMRVRTWADLAVFRRQSDVLVVAPHPFFPTFSAIGRAIDTHAELVDAVEYNAMYSPLVNFNRRAETWARAHGKPMVGNGDVHRLEQLGLTASIVDVEDGASPTEICAAIRAGRVRLDTRPLPLVRAGWLFTRMALGGSHPTSHRTDRA